MTQQQADLTGYRGTNQGSELAGDSILWTAGLLTQNIAFNSSGFDYLPAGQRNYAGAFCCNSTDGILWSSTAPTNITAYVRILHFSLTTVNRNTFTYNNSESVRCVKD